MIASLRYPTCLLALIPFFPARELLPIAGPQSRSYLEVKVTPDHPDWTYKLGQTARFNVSVLQSGYPIKGTKVRYQVGPERMEPVTKGSLTLNEKGHTSVDGGTLHEPGFIRLLVEGDCMEENTKAMEPLVFRQRKSNPGQQCRRIFPTTGRRPWKRLEPCR